MTKEEADKIISSDELKYRILAIAKQFKTLDKRDLLQAGYIGALKAIQKYDDNSDTNYFTYAHNWIMGEMYELTNKHRDIKVNKNLLKLYKQIEISRQHLSQKLNRLPSDKELSLFLEIPESQISDVITACSNTISLDSESMQLSENNLYSVIGKDYDYDTKILIKDSLEQLDEVERRIIHERYFEERTQEEVAMRLGINQVKVSRMENKSKRKIKEYICA